MDVRMEIKRFPPPHVYIDDGKSLWTTPQQMRFIGCKHHISYLDDDFEEKVMVAVGVSPSGSYLVVLFEESKATFLCFSRLLKESRDMLRHVEFDCRHFLCEFITDQIKVRRIHSS
jgi:hypothetical protein